MKKIIAVILVLTLAVSLAACSIDTVETLRDWSFHYNEETTDYSLFFGFSDQDGTAIAADATVDIRIENSIGEIVFEATKYVTEEDFAYYSYQEQGDIYLANLRISESEISSGQSTDGIVYFTVYQDNAFAFDECNCGIFYGLPIVANVETLRDWSFQHNTGTTDYSLFFGFSDQDGTAIWADATVDIRIENSAGEIVFEATKYVTEENFGYYSRQDEGEQYLANLRISGSEINSGKAANGTAYFTVYQDNAFIFDECYCNILYGLPIKDFKVTAESLPAEIDIHSYDNSVQSTIKIDSVVCETDTTLISPKANIIISGEKTYQNSAERFAASSDFFYYKLYDSEGFVVDTGSIFLNSLSSGDRFRDDSIILYDIIPGEPYTIEFSE